MGLFDIFRSKNRPTQTLKVSAKKRRGVFYPLKINDIVKETFDSVSIAFEVPTDLKEEFKFIPGQYLTFKMGINGEELRRSYSICSSPSEDHLRIAVKKVEGGKVSTYLNTHSKIGDTIEVMPPMGNFTTNIDANSKMSYALFAGGSGITPMLSILKTVLNSEKESHVVLFYANRNESSIIFHNQLLKISNDHRDRFKLVSLLDQPEGEHPADITGIMTAEKSKELVNKYIADLKSIDKYFICGPLPMMENVINTLDELGVDKHQVYVEYFTAVLKDLEAIEQDVDIDFEGESDVKVILNGEEKTFNLASDGYSILDAAIYNGFDAPYSCRNAVCSTCRAKLIEGNVYMRMNYVLRDEEVKEGFILTCQSHPTTAKVVVNYDEN